MLGHFRFLAVAGLSIVAACSSGGDGTTQPTPTIAIAASPEALSVGQGQSGTVQLSLTRGGNFSGNVTLAATGAPAGVTASISPSPLPGSATSATVTVNASASATPGTYSITVSASASGVTGVSDAFQLTITAAPSFTLTAANTALVVNAGSSVQTAIDIARTNLPGAVTLSLDAPSAGITGTFDPASPTTNSSQLTVNVGSQVAPGSYTLTVQGTAGTITRTTTLELTVNAAPNFTLSSTTTPVAIVAGNSGTATVTIARTNFTGDVALALVTPPTGITAAFAPATTNGTTSQVTITVAAGTSAGAHTLTVQGTGSVGTRTTTIPITVTVPQPTMIEWMHCSPFETPVWFAYRDGAGAWTRVMPTTSNGITRVVFPVLSTTASLAYTVEFQPASDIADPFRTEGARNRGPSASASVMQTASYYTRQFHFLTSEGTALGACSVPPTTTALGVTISGLAAGQRANVGTLVGTSSVFLNTTPTRQIFAPTGVSDYWIIRQNTAAPTGFASDVRRAITPPGPMTIDATTMAAASTATVTLSGLLAGASVFDQMQLTTSRGTVGPFVVWAQQPNTSRLIFAHPTTQAGDNYGYTFTSTATVGNANHELMGLYWFGSTIADRTIAMHPTVPLPTTTTITNNPFTRLQVAGTVPATYNRSVTAQFWGDFVNNRINRYDITATSAWLAAQGSAANYTLPMENLAGAEWPVVAALTQPRLTTVTLTGANFTGTPMSGSFELSASVYPNLINIDPMGRIRRQD